MPKKNIEKKIFTLDELKPSKHYKIKVKSFDKDKKAIGESPWIILKTGGKSVAPPNVTNLDADFKGSTLVVTWNGSAARAEKDFKEFRVKISSPNQTEERNFFDKDDKFNFNEDLNRKLFGSFEGEINITVYSRDTSDNESSGVSITAYAEIPEDPTNVRLTAAALGYNVSWDLPTFKNYSYTNIYESSSAVGTFTVAKTAVGSSSFVRHSLEEVWVKVSHVNKAGAESNLVTPIPASITPIDPVPSDVNPPQDPTNLNWESAGTQSTNGITTASMRAHWEVSDLASGYKVRVTEDVVNKENWSVYDVPASKAKVTNKQISSNVATLTLTAHSFAVDDYVTVFNAGPPFNGKHKITAVTSTSISFALTSANIASTTSDGDVVISSYTVKEMYPGTQYYGAILAYDGANNLTQFVSEGTFTTPGTPGTVGSPITIAGTSMAFGPNVDPTDTFDGLYINSSNFWYNTGYFNIGTTGNSVSWNGTRLRLDGGIVARGGSFSGNVFLIGANASSSISDDTASLIAAPSYSIQNASWSGGVGTVTLQETPSPAWGVNDRIIIAQASKDFDGEYTISSVSSATITFNMSSDSANVPSITNIGKVARINKGDRVIFNAFGLQGWENEEINPVFSFNRDKTSTIGGWTIRPKKIYSGTGANTVGLSSDASTVRIWAGGDTPSTAPFRVNSSGSIRAYGKLVSTSTDSGNRIEIGQNVAASNKDGLVINDLDSSAIENFWYIPSGVSSGGAFFKVGTTEGPGITVTKEPSGLPKVQLRDYQIVGVAKIIDNSSISIVGVSESIENIKIGKNVGGGTRDGIYINSNNYWTLNNDGSNVNFRIGDTSTNFVNWNGSTLTIAGNITVTGGNAATNDSVTTAIANISVRQRLNGEMTGVTVTSLGEIYSLNKTSFADTDNGWYLGWVDPISNRTPAFNIGDGSKFVKWDGSQLLINGKVLGGSQLGDATNINITDTTGININNAVLITAQYNAGSILFYNSSATGDDRLKGGLFDTVTNKYAATAGGRGVAIGSTGYYPFIEAGYDSTTGTANPRIRLAAANNLMPQSWGGSAVYGPTFSMNGSNFGITGGNSSFIVGMAEVSGIPSRVLGKNSEGYLRWYPASSGTTVSRVVSSLPDASTVSDGEIVMVI
jgi:hypothetical protein